MPSPQAGHLPDVTSVLPHLLKTYSHLWLLGMKHLLVGQLLTRYLNYLILQDSLAESYLLEAHLSLPAILWAPALALLYQSTCFQCGHCQFASLLQSTLF